MKFNKKCFTVFAVAAFTVFGFGEEKKITPKSKFQELVEGKTLAVAVVARQGEGEPLEPSGPSGSGYGVHGRDDVAAYEAEMRRRHEELLAQRYGTSRYRGGVFGPLGTRGVYGGGYGGYGAQPVYSREDPKQVLDDAIQVQLENAASLAGAEVFAPATGFGRRQLEALLREGEVGRGDEAGQDWEKVTHVLWATYSIDQERLRERGFDFLPLPGLVSTGSASRVVGATLTARLLEVKTRQITLVGEGTGRVDLPEEKFRFILGYWSIQWDTPSASALARGMVEAATGYRAPSKLVGPAETGQVVEAMKKEIAETKAATRDLEKLEKLTKRLEKARADQQKARKKVAEAPAKKK